MNDKIIVSKSEIEAEFKTVSQCKTADYCEGFNDALKAILDNAQPVNSEPVAWIEHHKGGDNLNWQPINHECSKATPLYTTPQLAPDSVPRADYDKLLDAIKEIYYRNLLAYGYAYEDKDRVNALFEKAIAEAEGK